MQGTPNEPLDLDALLATRKLEPVPVKIGGKVYKVRTDLTADEANLYLSLARAEKSIEAYTLLVGAKDAVALDKVISRLPLLHVRSVNSRLMTASRALAGFAVADEWPSEKAEDAEGESSAS